MTIGGINLKEYNYNELHLIKAMVDTAKKNDSYLQKDNLSELDFFLAGYKPAILATRKQFEVLENYPKFAHSYKQGLTPYIDKNVAVFFQNQEAATIAKENNLILGSMLGYPPSAQDYFDKMCDEVVKMQTYFGSDSLDRSIMNYHGLSCVANHREQARLNTELDFIYGLGRSVRFNPFILLNQKDGDKYFKQKRVI